MYVTHRHLLVFALAILATPYAQAAEETSSPILAQTSATEALTGYDFVTPCGCDGAVCGDGVSCGASVSKKKSNPCATSHKSLFYNNDFSYLNDPCNSACCLGDALKQMPLSCGDWGTLDIGGQLRLRYHGEKGMGREGAANTPRFQDTNNDFMLSRLRLYANWKVSDRIRVYAEGIHAEATDDGGDYFARGIDRNRGDFLNLFIDLKLTDSMTARVGRQELLFGKQRLVSPLDWANTRRTFEGARLLFKEGDWTIDTFYTHYVPVVVDELDDSDNDRPFYGVYSTYTGFENFSMDAYYLGSDNSNPGAGNDFSLHTLGLRLNGSVDGWMWEMEGGPQFGRQSGLGLDHSAMFGTVGVGRKLDRAGSPTVWCYYDYASGDNGSNDYNNFNQLYPLAHKYFGFIDAVQRSNIESPNILMTMKPADKLTLLMWYWHFRSDTDAPVASLGNTAAQNGGKHLGDELDIIVKYNICARSNALVGWSHFWRGDKINGTEDADFVYGQYTLNF